LKLCAHRCNKILHFNKQHDFFLRRIIVSKKSIYLLCFVLLLGVVDNASAELVAHWRLDDGSGTNAVDSSGNGHDGTLLLDPQWVAGKYGGALEFSGTSGQRVEIEGYEGILGTQNRTAMAWVKTTGFGDWISWGQNTNTQKWIGRINDNAGNGTVGALRTECSGGYIISTTVVNDGEWHHLAAVLESDGSPTVEDIKMYVDGLEEVINSVNPIGIDTVGGRNVWIGDGHHDRPLPSVIDDVRLYNHAMTQGEILAAMEGSEGYPYTLGPNPKDGALHTDTWVVLSWSPGDFAVSHDVYIGDNFDDVDTGAESTFQGNQTSTLITIGFPGFSFSEGLVPGTTYYWRIDEVNETEPNSPWKGPVWSFSIPPKTAYFPDPADGAEGVSVDVRLNWTPGFGAKLHNAYFGDNFDDVVNATGALPLGNATFDPGPLEMAKTYYWRVDEFDIIETHKGNVWSFTTEGAVAALDPSNGAVDVTQTPVLTWTPGQGATHEVYFGTDPASLELKASGNLGSESYEPGELEWDTTYYWRVDEADSANADSPWTGPLWSFTTANFLIIDDMEAYNDINEGEEGSNRIYLAWADGFDNPAVNGSVVGNDPPPIAEQTIVHSGNQSMPMAYDNAVGKSEATLTLTDKRDWTVNNVDMLTIWFRGSSGNTAEQMYVALNGSARVNHDDPDAAMITRWTEWNIPLQAFADQGVNLSNVNSITLGLSSVTGGTGIMYFDDIRLYRPVP
jgi:hypothetical protein